MLCHQKQKLAKNKKLIISQRKLKEVILTYKVATVPQNFTHSDRFGHFCHWHVTTRSPDLVTEHTILN